MNFGEAWNNPGRAHTPHQKREVIERLAVLWEQHPDLRLGQLIANMFSDVNEHSMLHADLFYTEDFPLVEALEAFYEVRENL